MKLSFIWILSKIKQENMISLEDLSMQFKSAGIRHEVLVYTNGFHRSGKKSKEFFEALDNMNAEVSIVETDPMSHIDIYLDACDRVSGDFVTMIFSGDTFSKKAISEIERMDTNNHDLFMCVKKDSSNKKLSLVGERDDFLTDITEISLDAYYNVQPMYLGGTFVRREKFSKGAFDKTAGIDTERKFFLDLCVQSKKLLFLSKVEYCTKTAREGNVSTYEPVYNKEWYTDSLSNFWIPYLADFNDGVPTFIQVQALYSMICRLMANQDNQNKHVLSDDEVEPFLHRLGEVLQYIDDTIIMNVHKIKCITLAAGQKWLLGYLKHGDKFKMIPKDLEIEDGEQIVTHKFAVFHDAVIYDLSNASANIQFMDYSDGIYHIDGTIPPVAKMMADEISVEYEGHLYPIQYSERYGLTKYFGKSLYKKYAFRADIPLPEKCNPKEVLRIRMTVGGENVYLSLTYQSHYSRLTRTYENSYWCFGPEKRYMARTKGAEGITFKNVTSFDKFLQECKVLTELAFIKRKKRDYMFVGVRLAYFVAKPFMKPRGKKIWLYFDKIYKGGDSSEYLYKYAVAQKDPNIKHYYLVDKDATDYQRLIDEGYKPLVRRSIKHRLVFMMADMMVISNSTAYTFNNFGMVNSSYVRDLIDSHACCVQHGMSVQKIAVAQNRLRDNTRLYFCASKYEIENLSKPIYDYEGYDALKLTGVPRYDGLVDRADKQIMISPTWRMQAAVKVETSEGEARGYNPLFKQTDYYKVYNSLINDPRLLDAAEKYGYKIKYVLHPIVSVQVEDFKKNDLVDIVPAIGDMSYEDMFCESSLMVTDYSGIQFDFAYMRKPIVYLHHDELPQHYEEGTFFYDTMGFGEIAHNNDELIDYLIEYMENDCIMKEEYVKRADDFFYYSDHNNCERIYDEMIQYQKKNIV